MYANLKTPYVRAVVVLSNHEYLDIEDFSHIIRHTNENIIDTLLSPPDSAVQIY